MVLNQILLLIPKEKRDFEQKNILSLNPVELQIFLQDMFVVFIIVNWNFDWLMFWIFSSSFKTPLEANILDKTKEK